MVKVKNYMIVGMKTGTAIKPDGSELTRITNEHFEGWFYTADLEEV